MNNVVERTHKVVELGPQLTGYAENFADLGEDIYHPKEKGGRSRRLAQHYVTYDPASDVIKVSRLVTQPFLQGESNKLTGHIARPIDASLPNCDFRPYVKLGFEQISELSDVDEKPSAWLVNCHQIRTHSSQKTDGIPVPEGIHKDGADFVVMGCVDKAGVTGGVSTVHEREDGPAIFTTTLEPGKALVVKDTDIYHMVSPIASTQEGVSGYRDMILMGFHRWERDHYRFDWKDNLYSESTTEH